MEFVSISDISDHDEATPLWNPAERPPDPMAHRVRRVLDAMKETARHRNQAEVLEDHFFLGLSQEEIARNRGCTQQAVQGMLERGRAGFISVMLKLGTSLNDVPEEEL